MIARSTSLTQRCSQEFESAIRQRGKNYFMQGCVEIESVNARQSRAELTVHGTEDYSVLIDWQNAHKAGGHLLVDCDCPYHANEGLLCKHIWASLLLLEVEHVGPGPTSGKLQVWSATEDFEEELVESDDDDTDNGDHRTQMLRMPKPAAAPLLASKNGIHLLESLKEIVDRSPRRDTWNVSEPDTLKRELHYGLDLARTFETGRLSITFLAEHPNTGREFVLLQRFSRRTMAQLSAADRDILLALVGAGENARPSAQVTEEFFSGADVHPMAYDSLLPRLCATGRFFLIDESAKAKGAAPSLTFDNGAPWEFELRVRESGQQFLITGHIIRGLESLSLSTPRCVLASGLALFDDRIARFDAGRHFAWVVALRERGEIQVDAADAARLVETLTDAPQAPRVQWPKSLRWPTVAVPARALLKIKPLRPGAPLLRAGLWVDYDGVEAPVPDSAALKLLCDREGRRLIRRDPAAEKEALARLANLSGLRFNPHSEDAQLPWLLELEDLPRVTREVLAQGWRVEAMGRPLRAQSQFKGFISSGADWFDLRGEMRFTDNTSQGLAADWSEVLAALARGEKTVELGDGSLGLLPEEWVARYLPLTKLGKKRPEGLRFSRAQGALLGSWLLNEARLETDADFNKICSLLRKGISLKGIAAPPAFKATLRPYQKQGLAWLRHMAELGSGGILADDMGLGKTVQVLAQLQSEHARLRKEGRHRPSMVIVPKSLLFNWQSEATRFAPRLKVLCHAGLERHTNFDNSTFNEHDLVLVTYATLRLDLEHFQKFEFHYAIADEAQAIKNPSSGIHQACLEVRARHRLAMTGTPVENSVSDLFAILDFTSPGLLGASVREQARRGDTETLGQLARALKPFILRREKRQVLSELPERIEKVIHCELGPTERKRYDALRDHYRLSLRGEIERRGLARSKIMILEALLRLRQAACHHGLIDAKHRHAESSKVETLLDELQEVTAGGHKALVFSQFTSLLDIVQSRLLKAGLRHERLDGATSVKLRQERVDSFQGGAGPTIFLISLKAGGTGLNLTAASYVFLLDPWWNPAAEAQAIDRAHRIGQHQTVIASRLIAKDTVEEKILSLQESKRELASALITADKSLLRALSQADMDWLLS